MRKLILVGLALTTVGSAQAAVTVVGSDLATSCYENALLGRTQGATRPCDEALDGSELTQRDRAATLVNRGIIYNTGHQFDRALADFEAALAIDPELPEAFLNRGNTKFYLADYEGALDDYSRAIELRIDELAFAYFDRALALEALGRYEEAKADLEAALQIDPGLTIAADRIPVVEGLLAAAARAEPAEPEPAISPPTPSQQ